MELPYSDDNANAGGMRHGGVIASAIALAGAAVACAGRDDASGLEAGTVDLAVAYVAAAIHEPIAAEARLVRRGREIVYAGVDVRGERGKAIATGLVTYRIAPPGPAERRMSLAPERRSPAGGEVPALARFFVSTPFIRRLGTTVSEAAGGTAGAAIPAAEAMADVDGALHEGAIAALLDTAGALASWSLVEPVAGVRASTVGIHVTYHARPAGEGVAAHARVLTRRDELFLNAVAVSGTTSGALVATGGGPALLGV